MKKFFVILLSAVALFVCANASAQSTEWRASLGYATTSFSGDDCSTFLKEHHLGGVYFGISREYYFSTMAGLTFEPGAYFYYQSGKSGLTDPKFIKMTYLSAPFLVKYNFEASPELMLGLYTGPAINIGTGGNVYSKDKFITNTDISDPGHKLTQMNIQWCFGASAAFSEAVQLRVGYALGATRLIRERDVRNNTFNVGITFMF